MARVPPNIPLHSTGNGMRLIKEIQSTIIEHQRMVESLFADPKQAEDIERAALMIADCLRSGGTVLIFGNGGSAADAQHIAGELVGRFKMERRGLRAIALTTDSSIMTSLTNDFGYDEIFSRQVEALGREGDLAVAISTSGNSPNILRAIDSARERNIPVLGITGRDGGAMRTRCSHCIIIPASDTPRIQEGHALVYHILCGLVEKLVCGEQE